MGYLRAVQHRVLPVVTVTACILVFWYAMAVWMNAPRTLEFSGGSSMTKTQFVADTWNQKKPMLPAPHQIYGEIKKTATWKWLFKERFRGYKRSLLFHAGVTLRSTLLGFLLGLVLGTGLAVAIVYSRVMEMSVMPWIITSQTIPILAIAPMVIVVFSAVGVTGLFPKAVISMYLSFFPVVIAMVKGLRSPDRILTDQIYTWSASRTQTFALLRLPSSLPYLFPAMKIAVSAALVGTIIAELPTGAVAGLGARLLQGSYKSLSLVIWSNLVTAAILAAVLVFAVGLVEKTLARRMGLQPVPPLGGGSA